MRAVVLAVLISALTSASARADRVHLVGGSIVEGKATRQGDHVIVELGSGELSLAASDVVRIESTDSDIQQFDRRSARLAPNDLHGMLELAQFCRDHDMRDREQKLLQKVLQLDPNQAEARARLGFVRNESGGWILREDQMRAQGMVQQDGQWMTPAEQLEIERARADAERARHERDQAKTELETRRVELQHARDASAADNEPPPPDVSTPPPTMYYGYGTYGSGVGAYGGSYPRHHGASGGRSVAVHSTHPAGSSSGSAPVDPRTRPFPIPGAKDPFEYLH